MTHSIKTYSIAGLVLAFGIILGATLFSSEGENQSHKHAQEPTENQVWTCSMHPQIRASEEGDCPICGMDLIPASQMEASIDPAAIKMSKKARQLAQVETLVVGSNASTSSLSFSGILKINQDQTQAISANFDARIEELYINEEGEQVNKGQVIAELYAPKIQVLKEELALAKQQNNEVLLNAITTKIENYELSVSQVEAIDNGRLKLMAPVTGVVSNLNVTSGETVKANQNVMSITDLSSLWAILDVYESDLDAIEVGDELEITLPNNVEKTGKVAFVSPVLDNQSRSAKVRVVLPNPNQGLKPGVFITAKYQTLNSKANGKQPILLPNSAVLWTGERSVVYQQIENASGVFYKMKEVQLGSISDDVVEILSGLEVGDEIVTHGAFSIDSEAQLANKPSMMNPSASTSETSSITKAISEETEIVHQLIQTYTSLKNALVLSDFQASLSAYDQLLSLLKQVESNTFKAPKELQDIEELRDEFIPISEEMIAIAKATNPTEELLYVQRCPMADRGEGARWLSFSSEIRNPYYGDAMLKCGSVIDSIN